MEEKIREILIDKCKDKKVCIWGFGKEGQSTYKILKQLFPSKVVYVCDQQEITYPDVVQIPLLELNSCDVIFKAPGVPILDDSVNTDLITSQTDIFLQAYGRQTIAITGTKGKSTTSSLLYHQLVGNGFKAYLVGNIGQPCFDILDNIDSHTFIVYEISCHQLQFVHNSASVAVLLNLYEEHLDHYRNYNEYCQSKANVYRYQNKNELAIVSTQVLDKVSGKEGMVTASMIGDDSGDIHVSEDGFVQTPFGNIYITKSPLVGLHNLYNTAIVYAICHHCFNICDSNFLYYLNTFKPLPHRLQYIGQYNGISYYDDSISTVGQTVIAACKALPSANILLVGGMDRGIDYSDLIEFLKTYPLKAVYFMYSSGKRVLENLGKVDYDTYYFEDLYSAVGHIKLHCQVGDVVLLSPGASSYDAFKNFEQRGEVFAKLVRE